MENKEEKSYLNESQIAELREDFEAIRSEEAVQALRDKLVGFVDSNQTRDEEFDAFLNFYDAAVTLLKLNKLDPSKKTVASLAGFSFGFSLVGLLIQTRVYTEQELQFQTGSGPYGFPNQKLPTA